MLLLLLSQALAAPLCRTPDALAALAGVNPTDDARILSPPPGLSIGIPSGHPPPPDAKPVYGTPYEDHQTSENFLVTWTDADVDPAVAERTLADLEDGWAALVEEQQWPVPVSGDAYKLWVVLDPAMSGTGLTTEYMTAEYPEGYPVIFLNPTYAQDMRFWRTLVVHEFGHMLQYRLRDYAGDPWEPWYWEASAQWQAERADPENDGHLYTAAWYAERPGDRYDSMTDFHQYGMFVFNAWLEEHQTGPDGLRQTWLLAEDRQGTPWDEILAESTGRDASALWADFAAAYGNGDLAESAEYAPAAQQGILDDGVGGSVAYLGTDYWSVIADGDVEIILDEPDSAVLSGVDSTGRTLSVREGDVLAVTGLAHGGFASYALHLSNEDGHGSNDDPDRGETGRLPSGRSGGQDEKRGGRACSSARAPWEAALLAVPLLAARRRYRRGR